MLSIDIIRAWKDEDYFSSLSEEQRSQLPENPAGMLEILSHDELGSVVGGFWFCDGRNEPCDEYHVRTLVSANACQQTDFTFE